VVLGGFVPVVAGVAGVLEGASMTGGSGAGPALDSHVRYLSGLLLAIGVGFWSTVPGIEGKGGRFRLLTGIVVVGGLGRLFGLVLHGVPPGAMVFGLVMELVVTPALCVWQAGVAGRAGRVRGALE
jgi:hypothetical protein